MVILARGSYYGAPLSWYWNVYRFPLKSQTRYNCRIDDPLIQRTGVGLRPVRGART